MADQLVTAKFVLDSTGFNSGLKGINAELRNARSELGSTSTSLGTFGRDSERLKGVQEALARQVELHAKKVDLYKDSIDKTTIKMNDNIRERDKLKVSLDKANTSYDKAVELYGKESEEAKKAKEEVEKLEKEYNNKEKAIESNAKQIQNYETNMNSATAQMNRAQGQLNEINEELARSENEWIGASKTLEEHSEKLKKVGGGMETAGKKILGLTAPLVGVGVASLKVSTDFEAGMSNVQALSGATGKEFADLGDKAKEMGSKTSMSATEASDGMANLALAGWDTTQIIGGIEPVLRLAEAGNIDLARASSLTTDSMSAMGIEVKDMDNYLNIVAQTARSSNTDIDQMAEAYVNVGGTLRGLNIPLEESALALGMMANAGIKGSEAGKGLNAVLLNMTAPVGRAADALSDLNLTAFESDGSFKGLEKVLFEVKDKTKDMTTENQNMYLSMIGGKEHIKTLNALMNGLDDSYVDLKENISNADGALYDMAETMQDNTKGDIVKLKSQLEGVGIQIGEILIPYTRDFVGYISNLVDKFAELDPKTQETMVKMSGLAVGMGGVLLVGGKLVSGAGALAGGLSTVAGWLGTTSVAASGMGTAVATAGGVAGVGGLTAGLGAAALAAAPFVAGAAVVGVAAVGIKSVLSEEVIPEVDLFADKIEYTGDAIDEFGNTVGSTMETTVTKISEGTQEAVQHYLDMENDIRQSTQDLFYDSTAITGEIKEDMVNKYKEMTVSVREAVEDKKENELRIQKELFNEISTLTRDEQQDILEKTGKHYDDLELKLDSYEKQIETIYTKASEEKRKLKSEEMREIERIESEMKEISVKTLSATEVESKVILERMKSSDERITAEMASERIKKLNKLRDDAIKAADETYNETVASIIRQRDESGTITAEQADKMIADAERQRKGMVEEAEETRDRSVKTIMDMNEDLEGSVDTSSGKILTVWGKLKNWWSSWKPESKSFNSTTTVTENKISTSSHKGGVQENWRGNPNFSGGLTTLHERGYEVYDLPRGTRIYNNEASEDMVLRTAEAVAKRMVAGSGGGKDVNVTQHIYAPTSRPSEIARQTKKQLQTMAFDL